MHEYGNVGKDVQMASLQSFLLAQSELAPLVRYCFFLSHAVTLATGQVPVAILLGGTAMVIRLMISLNRVEADALTRIADEELRDPREQLRIMLRKEAQTRGLLNGDEQQKEEHGE